MHLGGRSAKITFNNNSTYYTLQIWALIVEICNCHVGGVDKGVKGDMTYMSDMTVQWHDCTDWLFTNLIIQK